MAKNNTIKFEIELDPDEVSNISLKNQRELVSMIMHMVLNVSLEEIGNLDINRSVFEGFIEINQELLKHYFSLKNLLNNKDELPDCISRGDLDNLDSYRNLEGKLIEEIQSFFVYTNKTVQIRTSNQIPF